MTGRQLLNFLGRRGVAGLGLLRLRHIESIEKHSLQLLWRVQVEGIIARQLAGGTLLLVDVLNEGVALSFQDVLVHGDAGGFHTREDRHQRQLQVGVELEGIDVLQLLSQLRGQLHDGTGLVHQRVIVEDRQLLAGLAQRLLQMALVHIAELIGALPRAQQVSGDGCVVGDAGKLHAAAGQHVERRLGLVEVLRGIGRQPRCQGGIVLHAEIGQFNLEALK